MKKIYTLIIGFIVTNLSYGQVVINELDCNTPSIDDLEIIELKSDVPNFSLDGYVVVLFNGSTSGGDSSYFALDLDGLVTDINGILLIGSNKVAPVPDFVLFNNTIQNGADAVAIYQADDIDFPDFTLATTTNLIDALVYDTNDANDTGLLNLLGETEQINEDENNNQNNESIQRKDDGTYEVKLPTPGAPNDGSGVQFNGISFTVSAEQYNEGDSVDINFTTQENVSSELTFDFTLVNGTFEATDYSGSLTVTIPTGMNTTTNTIQIIDDIVDDGDEIMKITFGTIPSDFKRLNDNTEIRIIDNDFTVASWGTPLSPTFDQVMSTAPIDYYDGLDGQASAALEQAIEDIIADPATVRTQTYADITTILKAADQSPLNSNQAWLLYTEEQRPKLDFQNSSISDGKWNREHVYPRSRGGFFDRDDFDEIADGIDVFETTNVDSLRHGNSDAHSLRAADAQENSSRNNSDYGEYSGPTGNQGSWQGDVARSVFYMTLRYNGLEVVSGDPDNSTVGALGDLDILLDWHRNDPPDDYEMNRNNIVYEWQRNRNPFIDNPDLVEYIWGNNIGETWNNPLSIEDNITANIKIFPNPSHNHIVIHNVEAQQGEIEIFDMLGNKLVSKLLDGTTRVNFDLSSGVYMVKLILGENSTVKQILVN